MLSLALLNLRIYVFITPVNLLLQAIIFIFLPRNFVLLYALSIIIMLYSFIPENIEYVHELRFLSSFLLRSSIFFLQSVRRKFTNYQIQSFFWSVFSCIFTKYGDLLCKTPYLVRIQENTDHKELRIWTLFTQWMGIRVSGRICTHVYNILATLTM